MVLAWAEDRALLGSNPSAVPGAGGKLGDGLAAPACPTTASPRASLPPASMRKIPGGLGDWSPIIAKTVFSPISSCLLVVFTHKFCGRAQILEPKKLELSSGNKDESEFVD